LTGFDSDDTYATTLSNERRHMATINLRDFPIPLHREAKAKAAMLGITLKELIIRAITEYLKRH